MSWRAGRFAVVGVLLAVVVGCESSAPAPPEPARPTPAAARASLPLEPLEEIEPVVTAASGAEAPPEKSAPAIADESPSAPPPAAAAPITPAELAPAPAEPTLTPSEAVAALEKAGGRVELSADGPVAVFLNRTTIDDRTLRPVKFLPSIKVLNLSGTAVSDAGVEHLLGLAALERLYWHKSGLTRAGLARLQQAIPKLQILPPAAE